MPDDAPIPFRDRAENAAATAILGLARRLPYERRIPAMGAAVSRLVAPVAGWRDRIRTNLAHVLPDLPADEVARLCRVVPDNAGRAMAELYSGLEFRDRVSATPLDGPGVDALLAAARAPEPIIFATGHIGNYDATRAVLMEKGIEVAAVYRPMRNRAFNAHYRDAMAVVSPVYPTDRRGLAMIVRHLKDGRNLGIVNDIFATGGAQVTFFGKPAPTAPTMAEWALKFRAPLIPIFAIRRPDGLSFDVRVEDPIPHSEPVEMTQRYNDVVERLARRHLDQWFWIHRRWKPEKTPGAAP